MRDDKKDNITLADLAQQVASLTRRVRLLEQRQETTVSVQEAQGTDVLTEHELMEQSRPDPAWRSEPDACADGGSTSTTERDA
ncbi:MAG: hypothetical protein HQ523_02415 [Lentisphaerae bacterium]|nr:hypothetical protein [Lentisphaerota bacterium]